MNHHEQQLVTLLGALAIIIVSSQLAGRLAQRHGQPFAVGEIAGGIVLGTLMGVFWPEGGAFLHGSVGGILTAISQLGIILMMFQIGMEFDFGLLRERRLKRALGWITVLGIPLPYLAGMACAYLYTQYQPVENVTGLMLVCGISFSITALPILGRILLERGMARSETGVTAIAAAGINDLIGWIALGLVIVVCAGEGFTATLLKVGAVGLFLGLFYRGVAPWLNRWLQRESPAGEGMSDMRFGLVVATVFVMAIITAFLGVFAIVGGFLLGTALYRCDVLREQWDLRMRPLVNIVMVPVFFFYTGMKIDLGTLGTADDLLWCLFWVFCACASKGLSCSLAARLSGMAGREALKIGVLLNTRALMELVVLNIAHELGLMPPQLFSILVIMALFSTLITAPLLNLLQRREARVAQRTVQMAVRLGLD